MLQSAKQSKVTELLSGLGSATEGLLQITQSASYPVTGAASAGNAVAVCRTCLAGLLCGLVQFFAIINLTA